MMGVESDTLSSLGRAGHDIGLGALIGGNLFARVAMHPALTEISDERERGKVLNRSWRRYGTVNLLALGAVVGGWAGARADEARPGGLSGRERDLAVAKDVAVAVVAATGIAAAAAGCALPARSPMAPSLWRRATAPQPPRPTQPRAASGESTRSAAPTSSPHSASPVSTRRCRNPDFAARLSAGFGAGATDSPAPRFRAGVIPIPWLRLPHLGISASEGGLAGGGRAHASDPGHAVISRSRAALVCGLVQAELRTIVNVRIKESATMATSDATLDSGRTATGARGFSGTAHRLATETKQAFKTSEFWSFVVVVLAILVSAMLIKGGDTGDGTDEFIARQAWLYVAIVTGAYLISRGLAKAGSREPYTEDRGEDRH